MDRTHSSHKVRDWQKSGMCVLECQCEWVRETERLTFIISVKFLLECVQLLLVSDVLLMATQSLLTSLLLGSE